MKEHITSLTFITWKILDEELIAKLREGIQKYIILNLVGTRRIKFGVFNVT